jgi:hypothetical protein
MIKIFLDRFNITSKRSIVEEGNDFYKNLPVELFKVLDLFGGATFNNGLYRLHSFESSARWALIVADYFNQYRHKIYPFGFDWMGRQFCLSTSNDIIFMFDPATGESFELRHTLAILHNEDFVNDADDMLSISLFNKALSFYKINSIGYNECLGYKVPLFLGGKDDIENYELQDIEVYWHIENQLYNKVKHMPEGTKIRNIKIE